MEGDGSQAPSGLEQVQAMIAAGRGAAIARLMNFTLTEVAEGLAVFEGTPGAEVYNPMGTVHGGYAATLLDSACGIAVHTRLAPGQRYTTVEIKIAYHRAMSADTGLVRAEGRVVSFGRRMAFAEATLTDRAGRLLASATSSMLVMS